MTTFESKNPSSSRGNLLGFLALALYALFTLVPDSNSFMISWPGVFLWQVTLLCPVLWLLGLLWQQRCQWLGNRLDWGVAVLSFGLILSSLVAQFPMQARWYSWAAFCFLAALYAINSWLITPERRSWLLTFQGYLSLAFIVVSLLLWTGQTFFPELARLGALQQYGVNLGFDFSRVDLRNWAPIGHQNYVAGYLVLVMPLLLTLGILRSGWQRWLWFSGVGLGFLDLYTTSSRAGWVAAFFLMLVGLGTLLIHSRLPRLWLGLGGVAGLGLLVLLGLSNNRLRSLLVGASSDPGGGELAYRLITISTGWQMGLSHLWTGAGPGAVPLLYQQYRPAWAGREAELAYQLHSTPAHLWAELGIWSVLVGIGAIALLSYLSFRWFRSSTLESSTSRLLIGSVLAGLLAYGIVSLTDYQLDNVCISGVLVIYLAILAREFREAGGARETGIAEAAGEAAIFNLKSLRSLMTLALLGVLIAVLVWLVPIHRAWMLSSQGFAVLNQKEKDVTGFVQRLEQAYQAAPWEPYYAYQLGWNLGDLSLQMQDAGLKQKLQTDSITWLRRGIAASPYQEFGHSNLARLLLEQDAKAAAQQFVHSAQLVPAKRGVFYGLGVSLLTFGKTDLAVEAIALEGLRDPILITSPVWQLPQLKPLYLPVTKRMEIRYTELLEKAPDRSALATQVHQSRGALRWWLGNLAQSRADLHDYGTAQSRLVLDLAEGKAVQTQLGQMPTSGATLTVAAWLDPSKRQDLLQKAWVTAMRQEPPQGMVQQLADSMGRSPNFDQWLKQNAPTRQYRRERAGFGVLSRHVDGPNPSDFLKVAENIPMNQLFDQLVPSFVYAPDLDLALQPEREALLKQVENL